MQSLVVDVHQAKAISSSLLADPGCEVRELDTGDYVWVSNNGLSIGIESKTATDLVSSFSSGRLQDQVSRLVSCYDVPILLVFGGVGRIGQNLYAQRDVDAPTKLQSLSPSCLVLEQRCMPINQRHVALGNFLMSCQAAGLLLDWNNCTLPRVNIEPERVKELIAYWDKPEHSSLNRRRYYNPYATEPLAQAILVLCAFPGVSQVLATRIMEHFGRLELVFQANVEELAAVAGIGKVRAASIYKLIHAS